MRRRYMLSSISDLPSGYKRVEYLQSQPSGAKQYIDTGYVYDKDSYIEAQVRFYTTDSGSAVFGVRGDTYTMIAITSGGLWYKKSLNSTSAESVSIAVGDLYNLKQEEKKLVVYNLDKGSIRAVVTDDNFETEKMNLFLFASHSKLNPIDSAPREYSKGLKVYSFSIIKNGEKVVDLVPCLDNKRVPCFYDRARKLTLYNAGTGSFIAGGEI